MRDWGAKSPTSVSAENAKMHFCINVQATKEEKEHQNIILLLDVSGSMYSNADVTQAAAATIFSKLKAGDRFGQTPLEWIKAKVENGSELSAIEYLYDITSAALSQKYSCRAPDFDYYMRSPEESCERLLEYLAKLFPHAAGKELKRFLR